MSISYSLDFVREHLKMPHDIVKDSKVQEALDYAKEYAAPWLDRCEYHEKFIKGLLQYAYRSTR